MVRGGGFTVLELVAALALVGVVAGSGALRIPPLLASVRLVGAAHRLATVLRQARGRALERNVVMDVRLDGPRNTWEVREWDGLALLREQLPSGVVFSTLPASRRVRFSTVGTAENATITLAAGSNRRQVVINQRGRVRVQ